MLINTPSVVQLVTPRAGANFGKLKARERDNSPGKASQASIDNDEDNQQERSSKLKSKPKGRNEIYGT
jgi:hypothetical protein